MTTLNLTADQHVAMLRRSYRRLADVLEPADPTLLELGRYLADCESQATQPRPRERPEVQT